MEMENGDGERGWKRAKYALRLLAWMVGYFIFTTDKVIT